MDRSSPRSPGRVPVYEPDSSSEEGGVQVKVGMIIVKEVEHDFLFLFRSEVQVKIEGIGVWVDIRNEIRRCASLGAQKSPRPSR